MTYRCIEDVMKQRQGGPVVPSLEEKVISSIVGAAKRMYRALVYDRGVERGDAMYGGAENPGKSAENTAYLMISSKRN